MKKSELRSLIRECVCDALKEASYKPSDDQFIESWIHDELSKNGTFAHGNVEVKKAIESAKQEWKASASKFPTVRLYLMDLRKQGVFDKLLESKINEDAGMVADVAMGVAAGLMGLWAIVQGAPAVQRVFGDAADYLADKAEKKAKVALKNQRKETIAPIIAKFKNDKQLADMYQTLTPYTQGLNKNQILDNKARRKELITIGKYIKSKLTPEEMVYFTDISSMLRDGDLKESVIY